MTAQLTGSIEAIMQSICNQLISFQQQIADREENKGIPTAQEINMQCKLINCIDKLRRHHSALLKAASAAARDENARIAAVTEANAGNDEVIRVTEDDFIYYRFFLGNFGHPDENTTIRFKGGYVSIKWLEYNLYQYCLPPEERRFIYHTRQAGEIDYRDLRQKIRDYNDRQESLAA